MVDLFLHLEPVLSSLPQHPSSFDLGLCKILQGWRCLSPVPCSSGPFLLGLMSAKLGKVSVVSCLLLWRCVINFCVQDAPITTITSPPAPKAPTLLAASDVHKILQSFKCQLVMCRLRLGLKAPALAWLEPAWALQNHRPGQEPKVGLGLAWLRLRPGLFNIINTSPIIFSI